VSGWDGGGEKIGWFTIKVAETTMSKKKADVQTLPEN